MSQEPGHESSRGFRTVRVSDPLVDRIVFQCLAKDPVQRYQRAGEVRAALEAVQSDPAVVAETPRRDRGWVPGAIVAAIGFAAAVGVWWIWPSSSTLGGRLTRGRLTPVLSSGYPTADASLSFGKMVVLAAAEVPGRVDLYVARVAGGGRCRGAIVARRIADRVRCDTRLYRRYLCHRRGRP